MTTKNFLDQVYHLKSVDDTRRHYDDWSASYDQEIGRNGYATPARIARALATFLDNRDAAILDFGCGTGLSGATMKAVGFSMIDGCDLSSEMLVRAAQKNAYRNLWQADPTASFPVSSSDCAAIAAVGVISVGAAPPETLDLLLEALAPGGFLAFSFNDHTLEDSRFEARVTACLQNGTCRQVFRQDAEHLPGIGLRSSFFVLQRL